MALRKLNTLVLALALVACAKHDPVDPKARAVAAALPDVNATAPSATGEPHVVTTPTRELAQATSPIPASLHGRWALAPVDCTSTRGDAKGLLLIGASDLRFYESRAVPATEVNSDSSSIIGNFSFKNGEGQSWTKYEALKVNKQSLVRTEMNPSASFTYAKCS